MSTSISVPEIQKLIEAQVANPEFASALLSSTRIEKLNTLKDAGSKDAGFFFSKFYENELMNTHAGVVITGSAFIKAIEAANVPAWKKSIFLSCESPNLALAKLAAHFSLTESSHDHQKQNLTENKIHATAIIASNVKLGKGIDVGAYAVVESGVSIGDGVVVYPHCFVGKDSDIGNNTVLFPRVTLYEKTKIGSRCRIHSGAVIGADGFGYIQEKDQNKKPKNHIKIYHVGNVVIEDDVEIGANTTIDRGTLGSTLIRSKVKIDNQVQVGHNCTIGEGAILCGGSGMAGSSSLGKFVTLAANSGTSNQVHIGDYSFLAGYTGAAKSCEPESELGGVPARPLDEYYKILAIQNKLLRERTRKK